MKQFDNILNLDQFIAESKVKEHQKLKDDFAYVWQKCIDSVCLDMEDAKGISPDGANKEIEKQCRKFIKGFLLQNKVKNYPDALIDALLKDTMAALENDRYWTKKDRYDQPLDPSRCIRP